MGAVQELRVRVFITIIFCALGSWAIIGQRAKFNLGGDDNSSRRAIHVDAHGVDAIAIGVFVFGAGIVNLAAGLRDHRRIPIFWTGAALMAIPVVYGIVLAVQAVVSLFTEG